MMKKNSKPIGLFDSGVGGLSVAAAIREGLPNEDLIYVADQAHVPYGPRSKAEVLDFSRGIVRFLLAKGSKLLVVACNTASAAALHTLRAEFSDIQIVGMEPAVKPAAEQTESGVVGVLATPSTFEGELYASVVGRFAKDATVLRSTCPGLVEEIEAGRASGAKANGILRGALEPMMAKGLDSVVLGCTHYPFALESIREIVGEGVRIFDPSPAIAKRVQFLLKQEQLANPSESAGSVQAYTSGDASEFGSMKGGFALEDAIEVDAVVWEGDELVEAA